MFSIVSWFSLVGLVSARVFLGFGGFFSVVFVCLFGFWSKLISFSLQLFLLAFEPISGLFSSGLCIVFKGRNKNQRDLLFLQNHRDRGNLIFIIYWLCSSDRVWAVSEVRRQYFMTNFKALKCANAHRVDSAPWNCSVQLDLEYKLLLNGCLVYLELDT